jgi:hypothetical protein
MVNKSHQRIRRNKGEVMDESNKDYIDDFYKKEERKEKRKAKNENSDRTKNKK